MKGKRGGQRRHQRNGGFATHSRFPREAPRTAVVTTNNPGGGGGGERVSPWSKSPRYRFASRAANPRIRPSRIASSGIATCGTSNHELAELDVLHVKHAETRSDRSARCARVRRSRSRVSEGGKSPVVVGGQSSTFTAVCPGGIIARNNARAFCNYVKYAVARRARKPCSAPTEPPPLFPLVGCLEIHPRRCREQVPGRAGGAGEDEAGKHIAASRPITRNAVIE
jgi:hypothetical protein